LNSVWHVTGHNDRKLRAMSLIACLHDRSASVGDGNVLVQLISDEDHAIMAQSPETRPATPASEAASHKDGEARGQSPAQQGGSGDRAAASIAATTAQQGEAARSTAQQVGGALRQGGAVGDEALRTTARVGTDTARRSADALADGYRQLLEEAAQRLEQIGRGVAQAAQETTSDLRSFVAVPGAATESLRNLQDSVASLVSGVVQSNVRTTQEFFRIADPAALFDLQHRFVREYLDTLMQGTRSFMQITRQAAEQTLHPIEAQIERHQQDRAHRSGQEHGTVADVMSHNARLVTPDDTVQQATRLMREEDTGVLPVSEGDRLVGIITDRDVALRLVAEGKDPARTKVREVMTQEVKYVFEDEDLEHVADNMAEQQIRRLPVVNRNKRLVGVISLGDLARAGRSGHYAGRAMRGIAREPGRKMAGAAE
jgi:CBS domain-containing protein